MHCEICGTRSSDLDGKSRCLRCKRSFYKTGKDRDIAPETWWANYQASEEVDEYDGDWAPGDEYAAPDDGADLVGVAQIAELLCVTRTHVNQLVAKDPTFPKPTAEFSTGRVWERADVVAWAAPAGAVELLNEERAAAESITAHDKDYVADLDDPPEIQTDPSPTVREVLNPDDGWEIVDPDAR
jgi:hypothetical protein